MIFRAVHAPLNRILRSFKWNEKKLTPPIKRIGARVWSKGWDLRSHGVEPRGFEYRPIHFFFASTITVRSLKNL